jgi:ribosomal protein L7/L12
MHQIDRIEDMLVQLTRNLPTASQHVTKQEVASSVLEMFACIKQGKTIEAIRLHRQLTGTPIKESKDEICRFVDLFRSAAA